MVAQFNVNLKDDTRDKLRILAAIKKCHMKDIVEELIIQEWEKVNIKIVKE